MEPATATASGIGKDLGRAIEITASQIFEGEHIGLPLWRHPHKAKARVVDVVVGREAVAVRDSAVACGVVPSAAAHVAVPPRRWATGVTFR